MAKVQVIALAGLSGKESIRFIKFACVGALGTLTDFSVLNLLVGGAGILPAVASVCSFVAALLQNFVLNRYWTYPESRRRPGGEQLVKFALISAGGLGLRMAIFLPAYHGLQPFWIARFGQGLGFALSYNAAMVVACGVVLFWNFLANRFWTYQGL